MLQNAYFLAKIGADTAENEQHFAEILPKAGNYPTGPRCPEHRLAEAAAVAASCATVRSGSDLCRATLPITYGESPKIIE